MRNAFLCLLTVFLVRISFSQTMTVHTTSGQYTYLLNQIDSVTFTSTTTIDTTGTGSYLYIACEKSDYVLQYKMDGSGLIKKIGTGFGGVSSLAINPTTNELFLSDDGEPGVYVVHSNQTVVNVGTNDDFSNANGLAFDNQSRLLVADAGSSIWRYDLTQNQNTSIGIGFSIPQGIAFYDNTIYFSDANGYIYFIRSTDVNLPINQLDMSNRLINTPLVGGSQGD